jgi:catechol 2,3-dioxygenase-like lactoylglutathione lyase family enzyme
MVGGVPLTGAIGQLHVTVSDIGRSVAFYRDVLGLPLLFEVPGQDMAFFDCQGVRLYLGAAESPEFESRPLIYFRADSARDAAAELARRGAELTIEPHVVHRDGDTELWIGFFRDPDGTALAIMSEEPAPSPPEARP